MMLHRGLAVLLLVFAVPLAAVAQQQGTVQGTITDAVTLQPLSGAQVQIVGTGLGTLTNAQGRYTILNVPAGSQTVRVNIIGYTPEEQTINVGAGSTVTADFSMDQTALVLEGVVVTALGIEREARTLGVAAQTLPGSELPRIEPNLVNSISGRVAGVNITNAGPQGGTSRIVIRGENSITGSNQPLFIVDGIPIDNYSTGGNLNTGQGGFDYGNAVQDLDPSMIESMTVLRGPNAAALYGSRASNGVVLITTRKGPSAGGAQITVSHSTSFESPLRLPDYQNKYGQGVDGEFAFWDGLNGGLHDGEDVSWGPPLDQGLMIPQWNSPIDPGTGERIPLPWVSNPDNVRKFFDLGRTSNTNLTLAASNERLSGRFGMTRFDMNAMMPGQRLDRTTLSFGGTMQASDRLDLNTSIQYIQHQGRNRPGIAYGGDNPMNQIVWGARQVDFRELRDRYDEVRGDDEPLAIRGLHYNWNYLFHNNPYFLQYENPNRDERNRVIGQIQVGYQVADWLRASARTGTDWYRDDRIKMFAAKTVGGLYTTNPLTLSREFVGPNGAFATWGISFQETNSDFLLTASPELNSDFSISANFGANRRDWERTQEYTWVRNLVTPGIFTTANAAETPQLDDVISRKRVNSLLGQIDLGYRDYLYLTVTGRNDWSSTLPEDHRSYFYPSVAASFIFTDAISALADSPLTYGKLRASWAEVGSDTDPYQLVNTFTAGRIFGTLPTFQVPNTLRNAALRPERTRSVEFGVELGALDDRLGLDLTYYRSETRDQLMPVEISRTTGFERQMINAGTVRNWGWEALVRATPVLTRTFQWSTAFTFSRNRNKVVELTDGVNGLMLSNGDFWGVENWARVGEPLGQLVATTQIRRAPDGQPVISAASGVPLWDEVPKVIGNSSPDWRGGWTNEFHYGPVSLTGLVDIRRGGEVYSVTHMFGRLSGVLKETLEGRCIHADEPRPGYPVCDEESGLVLPGVNRIINGADTTYVPNETVTDAHTRWLYATVTPEAHVVDASFVKLREVTLSYDLPTTLTNRLRVSGLTLGLVGRNLALWTENPHIDPETAFDNTNVQGLEYGQIPSARSIGFTVTVRP